MDKFAEFHAQRQICRFPMNVLSKKKKIVKKNRSLLNLVGGPVVSYRRVVHGGSDHWGGGLVQIIFLIDRKAGLTKNTMPMYNCLIDCQARRKYTFLQIIII